MSLRTSVKYLSALTLILTSVLIATGASAAAIFGSFTLQSTAGSSDVDLNGNPIVANQVVATATYETADLTTAFPVTIPNTPPAPDFQFMAVAFADFSITDIFGNTFIGGTNHAPGGDFATPDGDGNPRPYAVINASSNQIVDFVLGTATVGTIFTPGYAELVLSFDHDDGVTGEYRITSVNNVQSVIGLYGSSGNQYVPEPSGIALLGAGFIAFGVVRNRRRVASSA